MKKAEVASALEQCFSEYHWHLKHLWGTQSAFRRDLLVTPYFAPDVQRRTSDLYLVSGSIGLVHQGFEDGWTSKKNPGGVALNRGYPPVALNIANFPALHATAYINSAQFKEDVRNSVVAITGLLERMPHDERSLKNDFRNDNLLGKPLDDFCPYGGENKFEEFKKFVAAL